MNNFLTKTKYVILGVLALIITSCLDTEAVDFGKEGYVVQFSSTTISNNFLIDGTGKVYDFEIPIKYYGGKNEPLDKDVTIKIKVNSNSTTATAGVEYELNKQTFIIPAGKSVANVMIKVNSANLDATDPKILTLEIIESSENISDSKYSTSITLQGICPSNLAGTYKYTNGAQSGKEVTIEEIGTGSYKVSRDNKYSTEYFFRISDVCNKLTVTGGQFDGTYEQSGDGEVLANGNIVINYKLGTFYSGTMNLEKQ